MFFLQHRLEAGRGVHQVELEVEPRLLGLFAQQGEALGVLRRGVGDGQGQRLALAVLQGAVGAGLGETGLGEVVAR